MDIKNYRKKIWVWAGILLAQIVLFYLLSYSATALDTAAAIFRWKAMPIQKIFAVVRYSVGDVFYILLLLTLLFAAVLLIIAKKKIIILYRLLIVLNICYLIYQTVWGLMYFQPPLSRLYEGQEPTLHEAKSVALVLLRSCQISRQAVKEDRNGVFKIYSRKAVENAVLEQQQYLPGEIMNHRAQTGINNFKPSLFKGVMSTTGILGYYHPLTAEAQYNPNLPSSQLPFTLAHESAHQLGFAREQEANFIGYILGHNAANAELRYSTQLFALRSVLNAIYPRDSVFVKKVVHQYSPGMLRDRSYEKAFARRNYGRVSAFFSFTNDLFLKSNRQDGAVTYSYFTDLLLRYEMKQKNRVSQHDSKTQMMKINSRPAQ